MGRLRLGAEIPAFFFVVISDPAVALGKFAALCAMPEMPTPQTLRDWIASRDDFPVAQLTENSRNWLFDLDEAAAFVRAHYRDRRGGHRRGPRDQITPQAQQPSLFTDGAEI
jgi:hypothetical protein